MYKLGPITVIIRLLICFIVGVIASVGVAWLAAANINLTNIYHQSQSKYTTKSLPSWSFQNKRGTFFSLLHSERPSRTLSPIINTHTGPRWSRVSQDQALFDLNPGNSLLEEAWGWPMVCLLAERVYDMRTAPGYHPRIGIPVGKRPPFMDPYLLPTKPIWIGLIGNILFYGMIVGVIFKFIQIQKNAYRKNRGLCLHCRYAVRDLPVCPECGHEVTSK